MHIPQDIVGLIVDRLVSVTSGEERRWCLRVLSLVSTTWVDRCQHHLFSTVDFSYRESVEDWCSTFRPSPDGVSRHVRVLSFTRQEYSLPLVTDVLKTALPHLTSFRGLQGLEVDYIDFNHVSLDIIILAISSFAGTLKRLMWCHRGDAVHDAWTSISTVANLLPNLEDLSLESYPPYNNNPRIAHPPLPRIQLSHHAKDIDPLGFKHFRFQELRVILSTPHSPAVLEYCRTHLRALDLTDITWDSIDDGELTLAGGGLKPTSNHPYRGVPTPPGVAGGMLRT